MDDTCLWLSVLNRKTGAVIKQRRQSSISSYGIEGNINTNDSQDVNFDIHLNTLVSLKLLLNCASSHTHFTRTKMFLNKTHTSGVGKE